MFTVSVFSPNIFTITSTPFGFVVGIDYISGLAVSVALISPIVCIDDRSTTDLFFFGSYELTLHHNGRRNWSSKQTFPWQVACCLGGTFCFSEGNVMFQSSKEKLESITTVSQGLN